MRPRALVLALLAVGFAGPLLANDAEVVSVTGRGEAREAGLQAVLHAASPERRRHGAGVQVTP